MNKPLLSFDQCCYAIVLNRKEPALNYAVNYALAGIGMDGPDAKVQALYILNNMSRWRGDTAKQVRESLKKISKRA
jgi:hypothetical protein